MNKRQLRQMAWTIIVAGIGLMVATIVFMPNTPVRTVLLLLQAGCVMYAAVTRP